MQSRTSDEFGDSNLSSRALLPVADIHRNGTARHRLIFWTISCCAPSFYSATTSHLSVSGSLSAVAIACIISWAAATAMARGAERYGIPQAVLSRAALGPRLASWWSVGRLIFCILFTGLWTRQLAHWVTTLASAALEQAVVTIPVPSCPDLAASPVAIWAVSSAGLGIAGLAAGGGIRRLRVITAVAIGLAAAFGFGSCIVVGIVARGFGSWLHRPWQSGPVEEILAYAVVLAVAQLPACAVLADVSRWQKRVGKASSPASGRDSRVSSRLFGSPLVCAVVSLAAVESLALLGGLLASAAVQARGSFDAVAIPDAAAAAGLLGGAMAALFSVFLWLAVVPSLGIYGGAMSCCALWPRVMSFPRAVVAMTAASVVAVFLPDWGMTYGPGLMAVAGLLAPVIAIFVVDELVSRRGRVILDDLYSMDSQYGPVGGFSIAAVVSWGTAVAVQLMSIAIVNFPELAGEGPGRRLREQFAVRNGEAWIWLASSLLAAWLYLVLRTMERPLVALWTRRRKAMAARPGKVKKRRPVSARSEKTAPAGSPTPMALEPTPTPISDFSPHLLPQATKQDTPWESSESNPADGSRDEVTRVEDGKDKGGGGA